MYIRLVFVWLLLNISGLSQATSPIQRRTVVERFNVRRNESSDSTPLQVGNGNFAFGADVTGLQTFQPFAIMSTWGWHNFSLPTTPNHTSVHGEWCVCLTRSIQSSDDQVDFTGLDWWTHGRLVNYDQPNPAENDISNWLIQNPQRLNLANIGLSFGGAQVTEANLVNNSQVLDLWTGTLVSSFFYNGSKVTVETRAAPDSDTVGIRVSSDLLQTGALGLFFDFPYSDVNKFNAPFVGVWNATANHSTSLVGTLDTQLAIQHTLDNNSYFVTATWEGQAQVSGPEPGTHRYLLRLAGGSSTLNMTVAFSPDEVGSVVSLKDLENSSTLWWEDYWTSGAFIDLIFVNSTDATELQRRIILSQYLMAVNSASSLSPQESGLVNNGWYGKFHVRTYF